MKRKTIVIIGAATAAFFIALTLANFGMLVNLSCAPDSNGIMGATLTNSQRIALLEKQVAGAYASGDCA